MSFFRLNFVLYSPQTTQDDAKFVRAIADFQNPSEPTLLKFKKGDIIAISKNKNLKIAKGIVPKNVPLSKFIPWLLRLWFLPNTSWLNTLTV